MFTNNLFLLRIAQLFIGLILFGISMAMMVRAGLGLSPWDVLNQGLAPKIGLSFGMTVSLVGLIVLLLWLPLRERPGIGTLLNILVIGKVTDIALAHILSPESYPCRFLLLAAGILLNGLASGIYIGTGFGAGPRDGLMTGFCRRFGWSVKRVRPAIELCVVIIGWMLGGTVGAGTVFYAACIGWVVHHAMPIFTWNKKGFDRILAAAGQQNIDIWRHKYLCCDAASE